MPAKRVALCFLFRRTPEGREVLLGLKKTGFGAGRIVTLGGKIEPGETPSQAAIREVAEESGIVVREPDLTRSGTVEWIFPAQPEWDMHADVFTATRWRGSAVPSDEVDPAWYRVNALPYAGMWDDAVQWLNRVITGLPLNAVITLNRDNETVQSVLHH